MFYRVKRKKKINFLFNSKKWNTNFFDVLSKLFFLHSFQWAVYNPIIVEQVRARQPANAEYHQCPTLKQLFQRVSFFFTNMQPSVNFPTLERILTDQSGAAIARAAAAANIRPAEAKELRKKLRFFGGIQLPMDLTLDTVRKGHNAKLNEKFKLKKF